MWTDGLAVGFGPPHLSEHRFGFRVGHADDLGQRQALGLSGK
jgi:hypothetical protein